MVLGTADASLLHVFEQSVSQLRAPVPLKTTKFKISFSWSPTMRPLRLGRA